MLQQVDSSQPQVELRPENVSVSVCPCVRKQKLERTVHRIILIFCMELGIDKARKVTLADF